MQTGAAGQASPASASPPPAKSTTTESNAGPIDLMAAAKGGTPAAPAGTLAAQAANAKTAPAPAEPAAPKDAKSDFAAAKSLFRSGDFAGSANALRQFLQAWPKDPSVTDATLLLGDSGIGKSGTRKPLNNISKLLRQLPLALRHLWLLPSWAMPSFRWDKSHRPVRPLPNLANAFRMPKRL